MPQNILYSKVEDLAKGFSHEKLLGVLRIIAPDFKPYRISLNFYISDKDVDTLNIDKIGEIAYSDIEKLGIYTIESRGDITHRTGKKKQFELAKRILKNENETSGIFVFFDKKKRFRISLVTTTYYGTRRKFSNWRRHTFYVDPELPNKTFIQQFRKANFSIFEGVLETFSLEAVSEEFYREFKPKFDSIANAVIGTEDTKLKEDFALLFVIRTIFLGFVQKKGWLGENPKFLQDFWQEYLEWKSHTNTAEDLFYKQWLEVLFFEALSSPPGRKVTYGNTPFSKETQRVLQMAPYLNGELFKRKRGVDDRGLWIPDKLIGDFFDFLFQYNFTVEENELYDEELELNPEFLGIIFERLTNMDQGAVYTPRVEVDMMAKLSLVKYLNNTTEIPLEKLYHFFFGDKEELELTSREIETLIDKLTSISVLDPAAGSGAFLVGMLQIFDKSLEYLYEHPNTPEHLRNVAPSPFERKKSIVERSLYGVEAKRWAVWISHLRLWLSLFVDIPDRLRNSLEPLLPSLRFKVRTGDSLVQRIGNITFPVYDHASLPANIKRKISKLKQTKRDFFYNRISNPNIVEHEEVQVFTEILNEEIHRRIKEIQQLKSQTPVQVGFRGMESYIRKKNEKNEKIRLKRIEELQREIEELKEQKRNIKDERPFIWSIEFAEIFFDKGGFDIVIGNPPYVRQEEITDPNRKLSPKAYKKALLEMVLLDFPEYFAKSRADRKFLKGRKPSGRSDLYTYFYIRSLRLLNEKGVHVFICSNAWLDVGYGAWLQEFFLRKAPLYMVIDNHARRSFARADINTVITVAGAPLRHSEVPKGHIVRFVAFKKPFEESVSAQTFLTIERANKILKTETFRVYPITVAELLQEGSEPIPKGSSLLKDTYGPYIGNKWGGKYLRAPDIFFTILEKGKGKLVRLGEIAEIRRGFTTGANDFFYLEPVGRTVKEVAELRKQNPKEPVQVKNGAGWKGEIEAAWLRPVIKSPREIKTLQVRLEDLHYLVFMPPEDVREAINKGNKLPWKGYPLARDYIYWGESKGYQQRPTLKNRQRWWDLPELPPPQVLLRQFFDQQLDLPVNPLHLLTDHTYYFLTGLPQNDQIIFGALINSTLAGMLANIYGRVNQAEGVLTFYGPEGRSIILVDPYVLSPLHRSRLLSAFERLTRREVRNIFEELGFALCQLRHCNHIEHPYEHIDPKALTLDQVKSASPDRFELDNVVFDALCLTDEERLSVYQAVAELVKSRLVKAKSVKRRRGKKS